MDEVKLPDKDQLEGYIVIEMETITGPDQSNEASSDRTSVAGKDRVSDPDKIRNCVTDTDGSRIDDEQDKADQIEKDDEPDKADQIEKLTRKLRICESQYGTEESLLTRISILSSENESLQIQLETERIKTDQYAEETNKTILREKTPLLEEIQRMTEELKTNQSQHDQLLAKICTQDIRIKRLEDEKRRKDREIAVLKEENKEFKKDVAALIEKRNEEKIKKEKEISDLHKRENDVKQSYHRLCDQYNKQVAFNHELSMEKNKLEKEVQKKLKQEEDRVQHLEIKLEESRRKVGILEKEKSDLTLRLSKLAGANLTYNNPNIADLSDANRPTKLAEEFSELYDNEWTDAFEVIHSNGDREKTQFMLDILKKAYVLCQETCQNHISAIKEGFATLRVRDESKEGVTILEYREAEEVKNKPSQPKKLDPAVTNKPETDKVTTADDENGQMPTADLYSLERSGKESPQEQEIARSTEDIEIRSAATKQQQKSDGEPPISARSQDNADDQQRKDFPSAGPAEVNIDGLAQNKIKVFMTNRRTEGLHYGGNQAGIVSKMHADIGGKSKVESDKSEDNKYETTIERSGGGQDRSDRDLSASANKQDNVGTQQEIKRDISTIEALGCYTKDSNIRETVTENYQTNNHLQERIQMEEEFGDQLRPIDRKTEIASHHSEENKSKANHDISEPNASQIENEDVHADNDKQDMDIKEQCIHMKESRESLTRGENKIQTNEDISETKSYDDTTIVVDHHLGADDQSSVNMVANQFGNLQIKDEHDEMTAIHQATDGSLHTFDKISMSTASNITEVYEIGVDKTMNQRHGTYEKTGTNVLCTDTDQAKSTSEKTKLNGRTMQTLEDSFSTEQVATNDNENSETETTGLAGPSTDRKLEKGDTYERETNVSNATQETKGVQTSVDIALTADFNQLRNEQKKAVHEIRTLFAKQLSEKFEEESKKIVASFVPDDLQTDESIVKYIRKCLKVCWSMCLHEPPVHIEFYESNNIPFDTNIFKAYTKSGKHVEFVVWPPLYLHKGGPLLSKGVAQGRK